MNDIIDARGAERLLMLVKRWGGCCVVCGEGFRSVLSVTREHVVSKKIAREKEWSERAIIAPSHHRCNQLKGSGSLLDAIKAIEAMKSKLSSVQFEQWINARVPRRRAGQGVDASIPLVRVKRV